MCEQCRECHTSVCTLRYMAQPRVRYFQDHDGKWRWRLRGGNGEPLCTSEAYEGDRSAAVRGFSDMQRSAAMATPDYAALFDQVEEVEDTTVDQSPDDEPGDLMIDAERSPVGIDSPPEYQYPEPEPEVTE